MRRFGTTLALCSLVAAAAVGLGSVFHLQGDRVDPQVLKQREDLLGTTSASSLVYCSLDGWRRQMVEQGKDLLGRVIELAGETRERITRIDGLRLMGDEVLGPQMAFERDPLVLTIDVRELGISGFQAAEIARTKHHVDFGASDSHRLVARLTHSDDKDTLDVLVQTLTALVRDAEEAEAPSPVLLPDPGGLELETVMTPREAFFAAVEQVPIVEAEGRIAAEMVSPYPPGVPVLAPGERITREALDYLTSGVEAGTLIPDAADPELTTLRVVAT
jgi:arginine/lysine/ornithine decarboxylase